MSYSEQPAPSHTPTIESSAQHPGHEMNGYVTDQRDQQQPGDAADPVAALWGAELVERFRGRWHELQLHFVDDPHAATEQAAQLVDEVVESLTGALTAQKQSLDGWQREERDDTEELRNALQRYRGFLDRLLGM